MPQIYLITQYTPQEAGHQHSSISVCSRRGSFLGVKMCWAQAILGIQMEFEGRMFAGTAVRARRAYYSCTSHILPFRKLRWTATLALLFVYFQTVQPNYPLPSYLLAFYLLHLAVAYLTPHGIALTLGDSQDEQKHSYSLSEHIQQRLEEGQTEEGLQHGEDKPLMRSLSEMEVWGRTNAALLAGLACVYSKMLEIEVFWPMLLIYFIILAAFTLKRILKTMQRHNYSLSDFHKQPR